MKDKSLPLDLPQHNDNRHISLTCLQQCAQQINAEFATLSPKEEGILLYFFFPPLLCHAQIRFWELLSSSGLPWAHQKIFVNCIHSLRGRLGAVASLPAAEGWHQPLWTNSSEFGNQHQPVTHGTNSHQFKPFRRWPTWLSFVGCSGCFASKEEKGTLSCWRVAKRKCLDF